MNHSCQLQEVELLGLVHEQFWDGSNNIKDEVARQIIYTNCLKLLVSSRLLDKVEENINKHDDINCHFDFVQILLG